MTLKVVGFPQATEFNKRIPKQKFYENLDVSPALRRVFVDQIRLVYWRNKLAASTLNIAAGEAVTEIEVFEVRLNDPQLDEAVLKQIDKEIPYHILFTLSWSHYLQLMRIKNPDERSFYEIEATKSAWSLRTLQRQYNSSLYERLALSRNKGEVMRLAREGNVIEKPTDIVKQPTVLEFLGLEEQAKYSETDLESAIIDKLQKFLLELGKGYLFEARQKRFTYDEENFYVDLVFYNRLLRCYVLIDLKIDKLTHQDLGQMQMYVNYYDRCQKLPDENPTIGILLCKEKNDAVVQMTLPENSNIFASEYSLYLPDKKMLQKKLQEWIDEETGGEDD